MLGYLDAQQWPAQYPPRGANGVSPPSPPRQQYPPGGANGVSPPSPPRQQYPPGGANGVSPLSTPRQRGGDPPFTSLPGGTSTNRSTEYPPGHPPPGHFAAPAGGAP
jgi:hypothetical protein